MDSLCDDVVSFLVSRAILHSKSTKMALHAAKSLRAVNKTFHGVFEQNRHGCKCLKKVAIVNARKKFRRLHAIEAVAITSERLRIHGHLSFTSWVWSVAKLVGEEAEANKQLHAALEMLVTGKARTLEMLFVSLAGIVSSPFGSGTKHGGLPKGKWNVSNRKKPSPPEGAFDYFDRFLSCCNVEKTQRKHKTRFFFSETIGMRTPAEVHRAEHEDDSMTRM